MSIDESLEALIMTAELLLHERQGHTSQLQEHKKKVQMDGEHIRGFVRIAELHHERISRLEPE